MRLPLKPSRTIGAVYEAAERSRGKYVHPIDACDTDRRISTVRRVPYRSKHLDILGELTYFNHALVHSRKAYRSRPQARLVSLPKRACPRILPGVVSQRGRIWIRRAASSLAHSVASAAVGLRAHSFQVRGYVNCMRRNFSSAETGSPIQGRGGSLREDGRGGRNLSVLAF